MGVFNLLRAKNIVVAADVIGALSLDGFDGLKQPFDARLHTIRPHEGQIESAAHILNLISNSQIANKLPEKKHDVQDPIRFGACHKFMVLLVMQLPMLKEYF